MENLLKELRQHITINVPEDLATSLLHRYSQYTGDLVLTSGKPFSDTYSSKTEESLGYQGCGANNADDCTIGSDCLCVENTGNFYDSQGRLLLNALPSNWPLVECGAACRCCEGCTLRITQRGPSKYLVLKLSDCGGLGIFASHDLVPGTFICLYAGEFINRTEAQRRLFLQQSLNEGNYMLNMRENDMLIGYVDPTHIGNMGRFLNHSCEPNCMIEYVRWGATAMPRPAIFAKRYIEAGEELTWNYNSNAASTPMNVAVTDRSIEGTKCLCGSAKCSGFLPYDPTL